ncbi:MAG: hypothetical protein K5880_14640 [Hydrogenophaga sp.]|uniref:hypothetical protein n=1 Tax=Hydrogenophaga sp. TaxID=1904254 RepID=UPI00262A6EA8|nr:hypothetical protein [Hydrogenophaga sp.]MCV0439850.1 hypothetical protein [Hydrogenophaga sp.]
MEKQCRECGSFAVYEDQDLCDTCWDRVVDEAAPPTLCAICGVEIQTCEICEDCAEQIDTEGIDPYEEYGYDHPWEIEKDMGL